MEVLGLSVATSLPRIVKRLGVIVEEPGLIKGLSGRNNLKVAARTLGKGKEGVDELLRFVGLEADGRRRIDGYSKGMRQRLALAAALLGDPQLLILDEPLDGLDPAGQAQIKANLRRIAAEGRTVVVSSHNLSDVEAMADHVVMINKGKLVTSGPLSELLSRTGYVLDIDQPESAVAALSAIGIVATISDQRILVSSDDGKAISQALAAAGLYPAELARRTGRLESLFLELTQQ